MGNDGIGSMPMETTGEPAFSNHSAHLVVATELLIRRARLPAIMFRFDQDPDAMQNRTALQQGSGEARRYLASSSDWYQNVIGLSHYLGSLLGYLSPRFWCLPASRPLATVLIRGYQRVL